jgi:hypothetical protein
VVKPGKTAGAEATAKATGGQLAWLRAECRDGKAEEAERPAGLGEVGRSQSPHNTAMRPQPWRGAESRPQPRGSRGGRPEHRTVRGASRPVSERTSAQSGGRQLPAAPGQTGGDPQGDGRTRPLGIPTVKSLPEAKAGDRIVQTALKMVIEPIFDTQFRPGSYGFRPGRSCKNALREVDRLLKEGFTWVVDADLQSYFASIPHDRLMALVKGSISDGPVLSLLEGFLQQDIMKDMARWQPTAGTPQEPAPGLNRGAVVSPLLANLYLHPLDLLMEEGGCRMVRYADDS